MKHNTLKNREPLHGICIKDIKSWFEVAIPNPTIEQACIQIGCLHAQVLEL